MTSMKTDKFTPELLTLFGASDGAYTTMTNPEVKKNTFNVKAIMRNLLIDKLGKNNIPNRKSLNQRIEFNTSNQFFEFKEKTLNLVCKFSKPDSDEMSIYLNQGSGVPIHFLNEGHIWYVFFKKDSNKPWFGIASREEWEKHIYSDIPNKNTSFNVNKDHTINKYNIQDFSSLVDDFDSLTINKTEAPKQSVKNILYSSSSNKIISPENLNNSNHNKKIVGNVGEEIVVKLEKNKLEELGLSVYADKVMWIAKFEDGHGYDIISYQKNNDKIEEIYIEVKTTTSYDINTPFYISDNEYNKLMDNTSNYYIYRLYGLDRNSKIINYFVIDSKLFQQYTVKPITYMVEI